MVRAALVAGQAGSPRVEIVESQPRERFAREVIDRLDGSILRYSMRVALLRVGHRLGLSRFDACLIIAQVQHRAKRVDWVAASTATHAEPDVPSARRRNLVPFAAAAIVQLGILAAAWAIMA